MQPLPPEPRFPIPIGGEGLGREVCPTHAGGGARAAAVCGPQSQFPTSVLGTSPCRPLPASGAVLPPRSGPSSSGARAPERQPVRAKLRERGGRWPPGPPDSATCWLHGQQWPVSGRKQASLLCCQCRCQGLAGAGASGSEDRPGLFEAGPPGLPVPHHSPQSGFCSARHSHGAPRAPPPRAAEVHPPEYRLRWPVPGRRPGRAGCPRGAPGPASPRPR